MNQTKEEWEEEIKKFSVLPAENTDGVMPIILAVEAKRIIKNEIDRISQEYEEKLERTYQESEQRVAREITNEVKEWFKGSKHNGKTIEMVIEELKHQYNI